jgi:hypothetical protein
VNIIAESGRKRADSIVINRAPTAAVKATVRMRV